MDEEDIDLSPEENDAFWAWLKESDELQAINTMLAAMPQDPKPNRNDPCPECASMGIAIKFKKCQAHYY